VSELGELRQDVQANNFCAILEVTNGISNKQLEEKVEQLHHAEKFIQRIAPKARAFTGILFFRNNNVRQFERGVDYIAQIPEYESLRAVTALQKALPRLNCDKHRETAEEIRELVQNGAHLEDLFYPKRENWEEFTNKYAGFVKDADMKTYNEKVGEVKGFVLEEYATLLCKEAMPKAKIIAPFNYYQYLAPLGLIRPREGFETRVPKHGEIDIIIAGPEEIILEGLQKPKYFRVHSSSLRTSSS